MIRYPFLPLTVVKILLVIPTFYLLLLLLLLLPLLLLQWKIPAMYHLAEKGFSMIVACFLLCSIFAIYESFCIGRAALEFYGTQLFIVCLFFLAFPTLITMNSAVKIWLTQQQHGAMLQELKLSLKLRQVRHL